MALTITIEERLNLGDSRGVVFKGVATTSDETLNAADVGLAKFLGVTAVGGDLGLVFSGATRSTTGTITINDGEGTATSGTFYGLAFGY